MIKPHDQRFQPVFLDQVIERPGAVLASAEGHQAVVIVLAAMRFNQLAEILLPGIPVNLGLFVVMILADVADARLVEDNGLMSLGQNTSRTAL